MNLIIVIIAGLFLLASALILVNMGIFFKAKLGEAKSSPFECGFMSDVKILNPFSVQFFLVCLIFLIFDVELILLFPLLLGLSAHSGVFIKLCIFVFVLLLSAGVFLEWSQSMLEWCV